MPHKSLLSNCTVLMFTDFLHEITSYNLWEGGDEILLRKDKRVLFWNFSTFSALQQIKFKGATCKKKVDFWLSFQTRIIVLWLRLSESGMRLENQLFLQIAPWNRFSKIGSVFDWGHIVCETQRWSVFMCFCAQGDFTLTEMISSLKHILHHLST